METHQRKHFKFVAWLLQGILCCCDLVYGFTVHFTSQLSPHQNVRSDSNWHLSILHFHCTLIFIWLTPGSSFYPQYREGIWAEWNGQNQKKTSLSESGGGGLVGGQFVHFLPDSCSPQLQRPLKWWITSPWARYCGLSGRRRKVQIYIVIFKKYTGKITFCVIGWSFALVGSANLIDGKYVLQFMSNFFLSKWFAANFQGRPNCKCRGSFIGPGISRGKKYIPIQTSNLYR